MFTASFTQFSTSDYMSFSPFLTFQREPSSFPSNLTVPTFALKQYCSNWKASGLNIHISDPNKPFSKKCKIWTLLYFLGGTGVNQAVPGRRSLVSVSITKLPGRFLPGKVDLEIEILFFSFYLTMIEGKENTYKWTVRFTFKSFWTHSKDTCWKQNWQF